MFPHPTDAPVWRGCGRVLLDGVDRGAGVAVAERLVITARHVVEGWQPGISIAFQPSAANAIPVTPPPQLAAGLDAAALGLAGDAAWSQAARARRGDRWSVGPTGLSNDPVLTGTVTEVELPFTDDQGNQVTVMQLGVDQALGGFGGYSGSAVLNHGGQVIGLLIEQLPQRLDVPRPPAANVLFALPIAGVAGSLRIDVPLARPAPVAGHGSRDSGPSPPTVKVRVEVDVVSDPGRFAAAAPAQPSPPAPPDEAVQPQVLVEPPLPAQSLSPGLRRIIGRRSEIRSVAGFLRGDRRLVTLWGPPGVGKSRLATEVQSQLATAFQKRVPSVRLEAVPARAEAKLVVQHMMEMLGVPDLKPEDALATLIRSLGQDPALLILDNCEHVTDAVAEIADRLLTALAGLRLLATSQKPLGVDGELEFEVTPLGLDDAVRLFTDLAWEGRARPVPVPRAVIEDICEKVDRIPLAIRLAAARIRDGDAIGEVRDGLGRSLRVLVGLPQRGNRRHQTMETALDWSYGLLDSDGQRMLRVASIFAAPFDRQAAGYVFGEAKSGSDSKIYNMLRTLRKSALIQAEEGRYTWLETIRQYGEKKLRQSREAPAVSERFVRYFLEMAEAAAAHAHGRDGLEWLARLDANRDHVRAALTILAGRPEDVDLRLRLAVALEGLWRRRGYLEWGRDELRQVLASSRVQGRSRALALLAAGRIATRQGDWAGARVLLDEALAIAGTVGDAAMEADALDASGSLMHEAGDDAAARPTLELALGKARASGIRWLERVVLTDLGRVAEGEGHLDEAERFFTQSLEIAEETGDVLGKGAVLNNIGLVRQDRGDHSEARGAFEAALRILTDAREVYAVAVIRLNLTLAAVHERRYDDARASLGEGLAEAQRIGARGVVAWAHGLMGWLEDTRARDSLLKLSPDEERAALATALGHYEDASQMYRELGDGLRAASNLEGAGRAAETLGDQERALRCLASAATLYRQAGNDADAQRLESAVAEPAVTEPPGTLWAPSEGLLRLEAAIDPAGERRPEVVSEAIRDTAVYVLGEPGDEGETPSSDLLHFTIDDAGGVERTMLPIFTSPDSMRTALLRNPDWQALSVLEVNGDALLGNIDSEVSVVVNPWTPPEFVLGPG